MFFNLIWKSTLDHASYLLCKNPVNFYRKESDGFIINGWYEDSSFKIFIESNYQAILDKMKDNNARSYVSVQKDSITPFYLKLIYDTLRSAITGSGYKDEQIEYAKKPFEELTCELGPFVQNPEYITKVFEAFNFEAKIETSQGVSIIILKKRNIFLISFFQQVYLLSLFLTFKLNLFGKASVEQIQKYMNLSESWFAECVDKKILGQFLRTMTANNKDYMKKWLLESELEDGEQDEMKSSLYLEHVTLHTRLFRKIEEIVETYLPDNSKTIIDFGGGEGKLAKKMAKKFPDHKVYLVDSKNKKEKTWGIHKDIQMNMLYPNLNVLPHGNSLDILLLIEVIEHLNYNERKKVIDIICNVLQPAVFIISTPNKDFNQFYGMEEGKTRHPGHLIEYNSNQFVEEIGNLISKYGYSFDLSGITDLDRKEYSTFIGICTKSESKQIDYRAIEQYQKFYQSIYLPISDYTASSIELMAGYSSRQLQVNNIKAIPFIQPTMAPVEYDNENPDYLEHPQSAIKYYTERGVRKDSIVWEEKIMGSNTQLIVFKDERTARYYGLDKLIYMNTRNGFPFFKENEQAQLDEFYKVISPKMVYDFYILNGEMTPWSHMAESLISNDFEKPLVSSLVKNLKFQEWLKTKEENYLLPLTEVLERTESSLTTTRLALKSLSNYTKKEELCYHIFDLLACGKWDENNKNLKITNGMYISNSFKNAYYNHLCDNTLIKKVNQYVWFDEEEMWRVGVEEIWKNLTDKGLEGFVCKPINKLNYTNSGYLVQPQLKVRGKDYLRIIYGETYLEKEYFDKIKYRNVKRKRKMAIQEWEISQMILRAWLNRNWVEHAKLVAFFLGNENINYHSIDATL